MRAHVKRSVLLSRWLLALPLLCCLSCSGNELNSVQGKVLYQDQPLKGVLVTLHPKQGADMHTVLPTGLAGSIAETPPAPRAASFIRFIPAAPACCAPMDRCSL
jgi:hypothetical protein